MVKFSLGRSTVNTVCSRQNLTSKRLFAHLEFTKKTKFKVFGVSITTTEVGKTKKDVKSGYSSGLNC